MSFKINPLGKPFDVSSDGVVETIQAGTGVTVDSSDPANPIVTSTTSLVENIDGGTSSSIYSPIGASPLSGGNSGSF